LMCFVVRLNTALSFGLANDSLLKRAYSA